MRWIGLKCSWLPLSARRAKPWVLPSNEINFSNGTLHCRHYPHGLESSARLVYDFIWFHRFSSFFHVVQCPSNLFHLFRLRWESPMTFVGLWSTAPRQIWHDAKRHKHKLQMLGETVRDSASARQCETMNVTPWHLTSLDIHCANLTSKEISEEAKISAFEKARMAGTHILVTGCENMCQSYHNISQLHSFKMSKEFEKKRLIRYDKIWQDMTRWHEHVNIHVKHHVNIHEESV